MRRRLGRVHRDGCHHRHAARFVNYLAHALTVLHDPWLVAGTSLPDWLRVVDRRARERDRQRGPQLAVSSSSSSAVTPRSGHIASIPGSDKQSMP